MIFEAQIYLKYKKHMDISCGLKIWFHLENT